MPILPNPNRLLFPVASPRVCLSLKLKPGSHLFLGRANRESPATRMRIPPAPGLCRIAACAPRRTAVLLHRHAGSIGNFYGLRCSSSNLGHWSSSSTESLALIPRLSLWHRQLRNTGSFASVGKDQAIDKKMHRISECAIQRQSASIIKAQTSRLFPFCICQVVRAMMKFWRTVVTG